MDCMFGDQAWGRQELSQERRSLPHIMSQSMRGPVCTCTGWLTVVC